MTKEKQLSCMINQIPYFVCFVLKHNKDILSLFHVFVAVSVMEKMSKIRQNFLLPVYVIPFTIVIFLFQDILKVFCM